MNIRSITYFFNPHWPVDETELQSAARFIRRARPAFEAAGYTVQTVRLATPPFPHLVPSLALKELRELALTLAERAQALGFDYLSLGPALPSAPDSYARISDLLEDLDNVFFSGLMTFPGGGISLPAVQACAQVIAQAAPLSPDGFTNLRFAALANVPPGVPFFPAAYHNNHAPAFALALEAAALAVDAIRSADSLDQARRALIAAIEEQSARLQAVANALQEEAHFGGMDFSLAPFPEDARSLGAAFERLGLPAIGRHGSLAAAAFLADSIDAARFPRTGFSGLMMPVLEDSILAARAASGELSVKDLLMFSAVCGAGLDTVPLPGDVSADQLAALLLDLAALSQRLDKPLTARLMPVPGKSAGDVTQFDFDYFANSRVMPLESDGLQGLLAGDERFKLHPRPR